MITISKSKVKQQQLSKLDAQYQLQFAELAQAMGLAILNGNQTVIAGIKVDYAELKADYDTKRGEIDG